MSVTPANAGRRRKLFVHIGMHKTGTTSIQTALFQNNESLIAYNIRYLRHPNVNMHHFPIALCAAASDKMIDYLLTGLSAENACKMKAAIPEYNTALSAEMANWTGDLIISSEALYLLDDSSVDKFGFIFEDFEIVPILVVRNFHDFFMSFYNTYILDSKGALLPNEIKIQNWFPLDLVAIHARWKKIAFSGIVNIADYDWIASTPDTIAERFLEICGFRLTLPAQTEKQNISLAPSALLLICMLRRGGAREEDIEKLSQEFRNRKYADRQSLLDLKEKDKLDSEYNAIMRRLAADKDIVFFRGDANEHKVANYLQITNIYDAIHFILKRRDTLDS